MSHINLLPWREKQRAQDKQNYLVVLAVCVLLGAGMMYGVGTIFDKLIENQNTRNQYLQNQISILDLKIEKIKKIREAKANIEQRIALIEQLQESRNVATKILNELVKMVPSGVAFKSVVRTENNIEIIGESESNNRLADFMRRIEDSDIFIQGELSSIKADTRTSDAVSAFKFTCKISPLVAPEFIEQPVQGQDNEV